MAAFDKVVAKNKVFGESAFQHLLEYTEVVDAFAAERSLVEDVLIEFERGGGVDVQSTQTSHQLCVTAFVGDLDVDINSRLHNAVAAVNTMAILAQFGSVERMSHGTYQLLSRIEHQLGVGVERDDECRAQRLGASR